MENTIATRPLVSSGGNNELALALSRSGERIARAGEDGSAGRRQKLNAAGDKDGVLLAWIDGRPAFEKTDIRFRTVDKLKIEQIWMNVYHGGTRPSPYDQHLFIDNVVIAKDYIGPAKRE